VSEGGGAEWDLADGEVSDERVRNKPGVESIRPHVFGPEVACGEARPDEAMSRRQNTGCRLAKTKTKHAGNDRIGKKRFDGARQGVAAETGKHKIVFVVANRFEETLDPDRRKPIPGGIRPLGLRADVGRQEKERCPKP